MKIDDRKPFTYLIGWSSLDKWYYGVRYGKHCNPSQLWTSYYTSSKYVLELRKQVGEPDVIQVRRTFMSIQEAVNWETKVLRRMKVIKRDDFLNQSYCTASGAVMATLSEETRAKIGAKSKGRKTFLGRKHSEEAKAKMRSKIVSDETRAKMSASAHAKPKVSAETRLKQSIVRTGRTRSEETKAKMKATWAKKKAEGYVPPQVTEATRAKHRAREARLREAIPI
jgi:hypothetical protein